jgi:hypothetical protein
VHLQTLKLNGNYGGVLGGSALAKGVGLNSSLRELHLHGNNIGDEGMRILGEELLRREKDFKKVKVSRWRATGSVPGQVADCSSGLVYRLVYSFLRELA